MSGKENETSDDENSTFENGKGMGGEVGEMSRGQLMKVLCALVDPMSQFTLE